MGRLILLAIPIAVTVYAFIDVLMTPGGAIHRGPKWLWAVSVLLLPLVGAVMWFVFGRPSRRRIPPVSAPDDDPEFLRDLNRKMRPLDDDGHPSPGV